MKNIALRVCGTLLLAALASPQFAAAQGLRIGPHAGLNMEGTDVFVGAGAQFPLELGAQTVWGNIGLDIYPFASDTRTRLNLDALLPLAAGNLQAYFGGGLVAQSEDSDTSLGINIKGGLLLGRSDGGYRPFLELNQTLGVGSDFGIRGGIFMRLGGVR